MTGNFIKSVICAAVLAWTGEAIAAPSRPWMNANLAPDARASLVVQEMAESEKLALVRGWLGIPYHAGVPGPFGGNAQFHDVVGSSGYVPGNARLGIPPLQETDASLGVANLMGMMRPGDVATALPSGLALGASFDPQMAYAGGAMIASEAWHKELNVLLAPGMNLVRDPRAGRNFEYLSEDPLLTGTLAGQFIRGVQDQHVVAVPKHFALNDQETNRSWANAVVDEAAMRESDLLAFELAIERGNPGAVMCSYNLVNGTHACGNDHLLNQILKGDWRYPGWVMSDWGAVHGVDAATNGLDQESAAQIDEAMYFDAPLKKALQVGAIPQARLSDMAQRILRSMFAGGLFDHPPAKSGIDYKADGAVALREAQEGIVLLKNAGHLLPLSQKPMRIAVIGGHADGGVLSGGGSSQVMPVGQPGLTVPVESGDNPMTAALSSMIFDPSPPLAALRAEEPHSEIRFDPGNYPESAAALAKWADVVIVFATQWETEGRDLPSLSLPNGQNELISAVAAANPATAVVLETGGAVATPWLGDVGAVVEAWYPGQRGGEAIADVLTGAVDPSGHLPISFPSAIGQYPRSVIPGSDIVEPQSAMGPASPGGTTFDVTYSEGENIGYRWFANRGLAPLFPFGHGLSYTEFSYSNLELEGGNTVRVSFDVTNSGSVAGDAVPQIYLTSRGGESLERLIGFSRVALSPGETRRVSLHVDPRLLADFDAARDDWNVPAGDYTIALGRSADDMVLTGTARLEGITVEP